MKNKIITTLIIISLNSLSYAEDKDILKNKTKDFLNLELSKFAGEKKINFVENNLQKLAFNLKDCENYKFEIPKATRLIGKTSIAIHCETNKNYKKLYMQIEIIIKDKFYVANKNIKAGQILKEEDVIETFDNVGFFPEQLIKDKKNLLGKKIIQQIKEGQPLKLNMIESPTVINYNQDISVSHGYGNYKVTAMGKAMGMAKVDQEVKVKMPGGKILIGIAQEDGSVILKEN